MREKIILDSSLSEMKEKSSVWKDFKEGLDYIKRDDFLRGFIRVMPLINAFFGATFSVSVAYLLRQIYGVEAWGTACIVL